MGSGRLREVDALRSFALGGILMVNIWYFADPYTLTGSISPNHSSALDLAVRFTIAALFEAKFYLLFTFLFGYSFVLQWRAAETAHVSPASRLRRRLAALFVLGLTHGLLLFYGDILLTYSLMGMVLLATHSIRTYSAVTVGAAIIGIMGSLILAVGLLVAVGGAGLPALSLTTDPGALTRSPGAAFATNASHFLENVAGVVFFQGPLSLAMFYIGLAAGRAGLLEGWLPSGKLRTTAAVCLPLGLTAGAGQAYLTTYADGDRYSVLAVGVSTLTAPLLTAGYVCLLLLFFRTTPGAGLCAFLAPAGRMALTNYLLQSATMALIFTAYGLRLSDRLPALAVAGIAVVIFITQLMLSRLLLSRLATGPAEWLLRRATYGRRRPQAQQN